MPSRPSRVPYVIAVAWLIFSLSLASWWLSVGLSMTEHARIGEERLLASVGVPVGPADANATDADERAAGRRIARGFVARRELKSFRSFENDRVHGLFSLRAGLCESETSRSDVRIRRAEEHATASRPGLTASGSHLIDTRGAPCLP